MAALGRDNGRVIPRGSGVVFEENGGGSCSGAVWPVCC